MINLPSKRVIWLVIVLVVITISILWFVGRQERKEKEIKLAQYTKEFLDKQKNIEAVAVKELQSNIEIKTPIELTPKLIISTSTATSTEQLRLYKLAVIEALKPLNIKRGSEPQAVLASIDKNDRSLLRPVTESRIFHQAASRNLAKVVVPKTLATQHSKIINDINFLVSILRNMEMATDQPQAALNNSKSFITNYPLLFKSLDDLNQYLSKNGIKSDNNNQIQVFVSFTQ